jgi:ribosomal protein S18 acetylase RimI-like enzyme
MIKEHPVLIQGQPILPEGYSFLGTNVQPQEIIELRKAVGWAGDTVEHWQQSINQPLGVIVGVRDDRGKLVGMGRITADPRHAVLCDLVVHPYHQQKGIGSVLVVERMRIAEEREIPYLYTELAPTNPLRNLYKNRGFVTTGNSLFRNSR